MLRKFFIINTNYLMLQKRFAGHSKWANIRHIKAQKDKERSNSFTKLSRHMKAAIQEGGTADPKSNLKLQQVIEQAKRISMPAATIQSVLKSAQSSKTQAKTYIIEIKGPGSCIVLCEVFTEHLHQLKMTIATILKKNSAKFTDGTAKHLFEEKGIVDAVNTNKDIETATEDAIEAGAEDVKSTENGFQFTCSPKSFNLVQDNLLKMKYAIEYANIDYVPLQSIVLSEEDLIACSNLYDKLESLQEVSKLYDNIA